MGRDVGVIHGKSPEMPVFTPARSRENKMTITEKPKKILVIDDEKDTVIYMETLLQDHGYQTVSASDGDEGLEKIRTEQPDLVLLDVSMPQKSGLRFYKEIKADPDHSKIPVFFVTGVTGVGDTTALKKIIDRRGNLPNPEGFFPKPIDREEFLKAVDDQLG